MEIGPKLREPADFLPESYPGRRRTPPRGTVQLIHLCPGGSGTLLLLPLPPLVDILQCLGTTINEFFSEDPEEQVVFHYEDYF